MQHTIAPNKYRDWLDALAVDPSILSDGDIVEFKDGVFDHPLTIRCACTVRGQGPSSVLLVANAPSLVIESPGVRVEDIRLERVGDTESEEGVVRTAGEVHAVFPTVSHCGRGSAFVVFEEIVPDFPATVDLGEVENETIAERIELCSDGEYGVSSDNSRLTCSPSVIYPGPQFIDIEVSTHAIPPPAAYSANVTLEGDKGTKRIRVAASITPEPEVTGKRALTAEEEESASTWSFYFSKMSIERDRLLVFLSDLAGVPLGSGDMNTRFAVARKAMEKVFKNACPLYVKRIYNPRGVDEMVSLVLACDVDGFDIERDISALRSKTLRLTAYVKERRGGRVLEVRDVTDVAAHEGISSSSTRFFLRKLSFSQPGAERILNPISERDFEAIMCMPVAMPTVEREIEVWSSFVDHRIEMALRSRFSVPFSGRDLNLSMLSEGESILPFHIDMSKAEFDESLWPDLRREEKFWKLVSQARNDQVSICERESEIGDRSRGKVLGTLINYKKKPEVLEIELKEELVRRLCDGKYVLPRSGFLFFEANGLRSQLERQKEALTTFRNRAANPLLSKFIFDSREAKPRWRGEEAARVRYFLPSSDKDIVKNPDWEEAVEVALNAPDLALVQGPPGTGKTTLIGEIAHQLAKNVPPRTVLIVSQANLAVDNALLRLPVNDKEIRPIRFYGRREPDLEGVRYSKGSVVGTWMASTVELCRKKLNKKDEWIASLKGLPAPEEYARVAKKRKQCLEEIDQREAETNALAEEYRADSTEIKALAQQLKSQQALQGAISRMTEYTSRDDIQLLKQDSDFLTANAYISESEGCRKDLERLLELGDDASNLGFDGINNEPLYIRFWAESISDSQILDIDESLSLFSRIIQGMERRSQALVRTKRNGFDSVDLALPEELLSQDYGIEKLKTTAVKVRRVLERIRNNELYSFFEAVFKSKAPLSAEALVQYEVFPLAVGDMDLDRTPPLEVLNTVVVSIRGILDKAHGDIEVERFHFYEEQKALRKKRLSERARERDREEEQRKRIDLESGRIHEIKQAAFREAVSSVNEVAVRYESQIDASVGRIAALLERQRKNLNTSSGQLSKTTAIVLRKSLTVLEAKNLDRELRNKVVRLLQRAPIPPQVRKTLMKLAHPADSEDTTELEALRERWSTQIEDMRRALEGARSSDTLDAAASEIRSAILDIERRCDVLRDRMEDNQSKRNGLSVQISAQREEATDFTQWLMGARDKLLSVTGSSGSTDILDTVYDETPIVEQLGKYKAALFEAISYRDKYTGFISEWISEVDAASELEKGLLLSIYMAHANVVGTTCNIAANLRKEGFSFFNAVIVDEVSKCTPPEVLVPAVMGEKLILVGDHKQLPPMESEETLKEQFMEYGYSYEETALLDQPLFKKLYLGADESIKKMLTRQFRMHSQIEEAVNQFYEDKLQPGRDDLDARRKHGINAGGIDESNHIVWINTPKIDSEKREGTSYYNELEVVIIDRLMELINSSWISNRTNASEKKEIGVITFYGAQLRRIRNEWRRRWSSKYDGLDIRTGTVDEFQGMEKQIVVVSMVRNNTKGKIGFAEESERVNVAFSRAQELLIIVGCRALFAGDAGKEGEPYRRVAEVVGDYHGFLDSGKFLHG